MDVLTRTHYAHSCRHTPNQGKGKKDSVKSIGEDSKPVIRATRVVTSKWRDHRTSLGGGGERGSAVMMMI